MCRRYSVVITTEDYGTLTIKQLNNFPCLIVNVNQLRNSERRLSECHSSQILNQLQSTLK